MPIAVLRQRGEGAGRHRPVARAYIYREKALDRDAVEGFSASWAYRVPPLCSTFAVENAGKYDLDAEQTVWVSGRAETFDIDFSRGVDVFEVQVLVAQFVAG